MDVEPPDDVPDHWHQDFVDEYKKIRKEKLNQFAEDEYRDRIERGIKKEREHRKLLNLCIFPFASRSPPSGFRLVQADPLEEKGLPNFDFLLWDFDGQAIFGEAKANTAQGPVSLLNEVQEQREVVEENMDYIVENYLGEEPRNVECVLATFAGDANQIARKAMSDGREVVTWAVHQMRKSISVHTVLPKENEIPDTEDIDDVHLRVKHSKHELNRTLEEAESAEGSFDLFPESDPVTKLRTIITARHSEGGHCFVNTDEIIDIVEADLFYLSGNKRGEIVDGIIDNALDIGFIREHDDSDADYKIVSRYTNSSGLEKTLEKKWIDSLVDAEIKEREKEAERLAAQNVNKQTEVWDFLDNS